MSTSTQTDKNMRLFRLAAEDARNQIGPAVFDFLQVPLQRALVAEQILTLINSQDEGLSDARIREMTAALDAILSNWGAYNPWLKGGK